MAQWSRLNLGVAVVALTLFFPSCSNTTDPYANAKWTGGKYRNNLV